MLKLENINLTLGKGTVLERKILSNLNLEVKDGEFVFIIGGNGAGKSTLFNVVSGFLKPDSGKVIIDNLDLTKKSQTIRSSYISKVMQDPRIGTMENMTIMENMAFAYMRGKGKSLSLFSNASRKSFFQDKLSMLGMNLENRLDELVSNLSGGQRQALSLIMAIVADSKILLLDEITAALDPSSSVNIMSLANKIAREEKKTCLMITHNMNDAIVYGDRIIVLKNGSIEKEYSSEEKKSLTLSYISGCF